MKEFIYNIVSVILLLLSIFWTIYAIFSTWGTLCFNMFKAYVTISVLITKIIWDSLVKIPED